MFGVCEALKKSVALPCRAWQMVQRTFPRDAAVGIDEQVLSRV